MINERVRKLSEHLLDWLGPVGLILEIAEKIVDYPKAHIAALIEAGVPVKDILDALIEAGQLERRRSHYDPGWVYELKPTPHVHEPYLKKVYPSTLFIEIGCRRCDKTHTLDSTSLPIEWPDDE